MSFKASYLFNAVDVTYSDSIHIKKKPISKNLTLLKINNIHTSPITAYVHVILNLATQPA